METTKKVDGQTRRDVRWITDRGELHEWYLGEWRQEYLIKTPDDYLILKRALEDSRFTANPQLFQLSEEALGENGHDRRANVAHARHGDANRPRRAGTIFSGTLPGKHHN